MKNIYMLILTLPVLFVGCKKEVSSDSTSDPGHVKAKLQVPEILNASNKFSFEFLKSFEKFAGDQNYFVSPFSIVEALSMTYNGANGTTKTEMAKTLGFSTYSDDEINVYNQSLAAALVSADEKVQFEIANSIWYDQKFNVLQSFIDVNQKYYDAEVKSLNFSGNEAVNTINNWVNAKTHQKIPTILDEIPGGTVMYLINAIYFKGSWQYKFDSTQTLQSDFYAENGSIIKHQQMSLETKLNYFKSNGFSAVELPYGNSAFNLIIAMPDTGNISNFIATLDDQKWSNMLQSMNQVKVVVKMPKFKFELNSLLNTPLINDGIVSAFSTTDADLSRIDGAHDLYISRVLHKTYIDLNEQGTEAAAVTAVEVGYTAMPINGNKEKTYYFEANKPFVYGIVEKLTGAVLFLGKMMDPTVTNVELK